MSEFKEDAGTYLKVVRFAEPTNPDAFLLLYLRLQGWFLFLGYWRGYERTVAAGRWYRQDAQLQLEGKGQLSNDTGRGGGAFVRTFIVEVSNHTPTLTGVGEATGWSLLSWNGPFIYVGRMTIFDPDGQWLPKSISEVDNRIEQLIASRDAV